MLLALFITAQSVSSLEGEPREHLDQGGGLARDESSIAAARPAIAPNGSVGAFFDFDGSTPLEESVRGLGDANTVAAGTILKSGMVVTLKETSRGGYCSAMTAKCTAKKAGHNQKFLVVRATGRYMALLGGCRPSGFQCVTQIPARAEMVASDQGKGRVKLTMKASGHVKEYVLGCVRNCRDSR